jgi:hypothetical protein
VGTCIAQKVQITLNVRIGGKLVQTLIHPSDPASGPSITPGGVYEWESVSFPLTLDELGALRTGALVEMKIQNISAEVVRKDGDVYKVVGDWSPYFAAAESTSAHLFLDLGDGRTTEHLVYAGDDPWEPKITVGDALIWAANGYETTEGPFVRFYQPGGSLGDPESLDKWYFSLDTETYSQIPGDNFFNTVLSPDSVLVAKAPPINPTPRIHWAVFSPLEGELTAYVDDYFVTQSRLTVNFVDKFGKTWPMTWNADRLFFSCECPVNYIKGGTEKIVAKNPLYNNLNDPDRLKYRTVMAASEIAEMPTPAIIGSCSLWDTNYALDVFVKDNYAYVANSSAGLQIIDITEPANPRVVGQYNTPLEAKGVFVEGNFAYVADYGYNGALLVIDIRNPTAPLLKGNCPTPWGATSVYVKDSYAYVTDYGDGANSGLRVIDISVPESPKLKGNCTIPWGATDVYVKGNYAYVSNAGNGFQVVDVSNPEAPSLINWSLGGSGWDVYVKDNYAYVADWSAGLQVVDITIPTSPKLKGTCHTPGGASGVFVYGNYAYVADSNAGLQMIDISNPESPKIVFTCDTPGSSENSFRIGDYIYEVDKWGGLNVISFK